MHFKNAFQIHLKCIENAFFSKMHFTKRILKTHF
jgi:hypothetical protein